MPDEIYYSYKAIDQQQLEAQLDRLWQDLQGDSALATEAEQAGIVLSEIRKRPRKEVITVRKDGEGFDPVTTALVVAFAPVAARVARDLWLKVLLPRILKAKGKDSLEPKEPKE